MESSNGNENKFALNDDLIGRCFRSRFLRIAIVYTVAVFPNGETKAIASEKILACVQRVPSERSSFPTVDYVLQANGRAKGL